MQHTNESYYNILFTQFDLVRDVVDPNCLRCFNALNVEVLLHFGSDVDEL